MCGRSVAVNAFCLVFRVVDSNVFYAYLVHNNNNLSFRCNRSNGVYLRCIYFGSHELVLCDSIAVCELHGTGTGTVKMVPR